MTAPAMATVPKSSANASPRAASSAIVGVEVLDGEPHQGEGAGEDSVDSNRANVSALQR
jgi:hypothetical protein